MGEVIPFLVHGVSLQASKDEALVDATIEVLGTNAKLAQAVQDLADVFVRLDGAIAENPVNACVRRPIDAIVEQDRQKLLLNMRDLLESISEYTGGVRDRMRCAIEGRADSTRL